MDIEVLADDRTGALETAGAIASRVGTSVAVVPAATACSSPGHRGMSGTVVVDTGTRRMGPDDAAAVVVGCDAAAVRSSGRMPLRRGHKIDSTLRGNWAHEIVARHLVENRPVLLVPALPELGRTCRGGTVLLDGEPVHEHVGRAGGDPVDPPSSRPAEHLVDAALRVDGGVVVGELASVLDVERWCRDPAGIAIADAASNADLDRIGAVWAAYPDLVLAGTSDAVAAGVARVVREADVADVAQVADPAAPTYRQPPTPSAGGCLVVCGSRQVGARAQLDALSAADVTVVEGLLGDAELDLLGAGGLVALASPPPGADGASAAASGRVLERLTAEVRRACEMAGAASGSPALVLVGGDTAAAVLGGRTVVVEGLVRAGTPWGTLDDGTIVVTRAGGFGDRQALVELAAQLCGTLAR